MIFINDLRRNYESMGLPEEFAFCIPDVCPDCGAPMVMSETLTGLHCSNPKCGSKLVMRIRQICKDMNVLYFGESAIERFINYYDVTNPLDIFWEYVRVANIPFVRTSARPIFSGYRNLTEAYKDIEDGGVEFIRNKLGIKGDDDEISIQAVKVYTSLIENKDDLLEDEPFVRIISTEGKKELNVVCSDQVGGSFKTKPEFYAYIKGEFGESYQVNFLTSVNKKIDYLVWAGADGSPARYTSKVQKVEKYNKDGCNIPIVTANQFIKILKNL